VTKRMEMYQFAFDESADIAVREIQHGMAIVLDEHAQTPPDSMNDTITGCSSCQEVLGWDQLCSLLEGLYKAIHPLIVGRIP
jgi:hypothetical protein